MNLLNAATILCIGPLTGAELAVSAFVNPVLWRLDPDAQSGAVRLFARRMGAAMPLWYAAGLLLLLARILTPPHRSPVLLGAAVALWGVAIALSLLCLVPINNRLARMGADGWTESARREHRRWDAIHRVRIAAVAAALICLLTGTGS